MITSQSVAHEGILSNNGRACGCQVDVWSPYCKEGSGCEWPTFRKITNEIN